MDFGSLNMENIENILSSMSSEDMEMLSSMAQSFFSSGQQREDKKESQAPSGGGNPFSSFNIDMEAVGRIMSLMERMNNTPESPGYKLLLSLRPMLSSQRQGKVDEALKILSLLSLLPLIGELGGK